MSREVQADITPQFTCRKKITLRSMEAGVLLPLLPSFPSYMCVYTWVYMYTWTHTHMLTHTYMKYIYSIIYNITYIWVCFYLCICVWVHVLCRGAHEGQKRVSDLPRVEVTGSCQPANVGSVVRTLDTSHLEKSALQYRDVLKVTAHQHQLTSLLWLLFTQGF